MRKVFILIGLILFGLFVVKIGSSLSCSIPGYRVQFWCSSNGAGCTKGSPTWLECRSSKWEGCGGGSSCSTGYNIRELIGSGNSDCTHCSWTCNTTYKDVAYCNLSLGYRDQKEPLSCSTTSCNGCNYPSPWTTVRWPSKDSDCCTPSLTTANYSGQCGTNFSNGCTESLKVNCSSGFNCNVSSGRGVCLPDTSINQSTSINRSYWANLRNGSEIASAQLGDSVVMVFGGQNLEGKSINYSIQDYSSGNWFQRLLGIKNWGDFVSIGSSSSTEVYSNLNVSTIYKFNVLVEGTTIGNTSSNLTISAQVDNFVPFVEITSIPKSNQTSFFRTSTNFPVWFNQTSYDEDDLLNLTWNFGDGNVSSFSEYSSFLTPTLGNVSYTYTGGGRFYDVVLTAKEMPPRANPRTTSSSNRIYVFKPGVNVVPIISAPLINSAQGHWVDYNVSQSYVVNCSTTGPIGTLGGFTVGNLNCTYILALGAKNVTSGKVEVRWKEINPSGEAVWFVGNSSSGVVWNEVNYNSAVVFSKMYRNAQYRRVVMEMSYSV